MVTHTYCIRILTRNYGMNDMDQYITKLVLHVYSMDTRYILWCNNTTVKSTYFKTQQSVLWIQEFLVNVHIQYNANQNHQ